MTQLQTYYNRSLGAAVSRASLECEIDTEVCVIGAGLAGLGTALELARAGVNVVVLEGHQIGFGASGRNGGFVGPAWSQRLDVLTRRLGVKQAHDLYKLSQEGVAIIEQNIADLEIGDVDLKRGKLSCARSPSRDAFLRRRDFLQEQFGINVEVWQTEQVRAVLKTHRYFEALFYPDDFQINPLAYCRGLASEIERLGGRVFENSPAIKLDRSDANRTVHTPQGAVIADQVVIASGGYTGTWARPLFHSYVPIATYVMLTQPEPDLIARAIQTSYAVGDQRRAGDYYRLVEGGRRILWGGRITTRTSEPRRLAELLRSTMIATYPQLKELGIDYAWSGLMSYARHLMPQIRPVYDGVWSCTAFGGHGINTTAIGGRILAEAILRKSDRWRLFAPFDFAWNGGPFGRAAVQATYWWLQTRDAMTERLSREADTGA